MSAISSFATAFRGGNSDRPVRAILTPLEEDASPDRAAAAARVFQYFPESLQDTRGVDYQAKQIPGLSHPLYQWTTGGAREISFTAIFTRDRALTSQEKAAALSASTVARVGGSTARYGISDMRNVDIPSAISWLRSYTYPEFAINGQNQYSRPRPPRRLVLTLPGLRINQGTPELNDDDVRCIMTQCEVTYEGFFADGTPRIARVGLAFAEIIQYNNGVTPVSAQGLRGVGISGYNLTNRNGR